MMSKIARSPWHIDNSMHVHPMIKMTHLQLRHHRWRFQLRPSLRKSRTSIAFNWRACHQISLIHMLRDPSEAKCLEINSYICTHKDKNKSHFRPYPQSSSLAPRWGWKRHNLNLPFLAQLTKLPKNPTKIQQKNSLTPRTLNQMTMLLTPLIPLQMCLKRNPITPLLMNPPTTQQRRLGPRRPP